MGTEVHRTEFVRFVSSNGEPRPTARRLQIQTPLDNSSDTDCWTHARIYAAEHPEATYFEGTCFRRVTPRGPKVLSVHAWVEEPSPFGGQRVVELTEGYEDAFGYIGIPITGDWLEGKRPENGYWDGRYYSLLELSFASTNVR